MMSWAGALAWVVWLWTCATVLLRVGVDLADTLTRGARWVRSVRLLSDWLTLPIVSRAVDASLAGVMLARPHVTTAVVEASPSDQVVFQTTAQHLSPVGEGWTTIPLSMQGEVDSQCAGQNTHHGNDEVL